MNRILGSGEPSGGRPTTKKCSNIGRSFFELEKRRTLLRTRPWEIFRRATALVTRSLPINSIRPNCGVVVQFLKRGRVEVRKKSLTFCGATPKTIYDAVCRSQFSV